MYHLLRKQIILFFLLVIAAIFSTTLHAQDKEIYRQEHDNMLYYFGITLGYNSTYISPTKSKAFLHQDSISTAIPSSGGGISLGFLGTLKLNEHFQLRINPQLVLGGGKTINYTSPKGVPFSEKLPSTLIGLPIHIKFNSDRIDNFRFYTLGGIRYDYDMSSNASPDGYIKQKASSFSLETGVGFNFFMPFVTISPEIKFTYGLTNLNQPTSSIYSQVFDKLQERMISFSIHFED